MAPPKKRLPESIPISRARQQLCPLVEELARAPGGKVAITVGEEVAAYLVTPAKMAELQAKASEPRPSLVGSIRVIGDPDAPELEGYAWRETLKNLDAEWKEREEDGCA